jgi:hypothetical protein
MGQRLGHRGGAVMNVHRSFWVGLTVVGLLAAGSFAVIPAQADSCPNEALRQELNSGSLPDCRAYELVTPPYKEGYQVNVKAFSSDGHKAVLTTLANLAGDPGSDQTALEDGVYLETRGVGGWQISPLNPPLSEFIGQIPLAFEADSGMSLWDQHTPQQSPSTRGLYIRSIAGEYSYVGPLNPYAGSEEESDLIEPNEFDYTEPLAATSDYGHVVLWASDGNYWGFDKTTGKEGSLYEYSGLNNEHPILVAVTEPKKGSESLIGECGSVFGGGPSGSEYNALSADGETIFFTAECEGSGPSVGPEVAEVYARVDGSLASPAAAETVHVSENKCTVACGGVSGKNFEGASANGEKVFFTSTQKLTNNATGNTVNGNAAEEPGCPEIGGSGCNLYEYDLAASGEGLRLIADSVLGVAAIAEDGSRVYFVAREAFAGAKANRSGGTPRKSEPNLYVYDTEDGETAFIVTLSSRDGGDWVRDAFRRSVQVAGDGAQFLLFSSSEPGLTADDLEGTAPQLFEYDAESGELVRVSQGEDGYNDDGQHVSSGLALLGGEEPGFRSAANKSSVADDGRTVVFVTGGALSPLAVSAEKGCSSVYEFRTGGALSAGSVHLVSDGRDVQPDRGEACGATFVGMDADGDNILFSTADPLVSSDVDGVQRDIYNARVEGGFPPIVHAPVCKGEACLGAFSGPPGSPVPGSVSQAPEAPVSPTSVTRPTSKTTTKTVTKCSKGKKLSHGKKCVKARTKDKSNKTKKASNDRRSR